MNKLENISIIGGGTAGFVSALILKIRYPRLNVKIVRSKKIGIIGVGEGSTEHWDSFLKYIGVSWQDCIRACDATFKCGILFKGWSKTDYMHSTGPDLEKLNGESLFIYNKIIGNNLPKKIMNPAGNWESRIFVSDLEKPEAPFNQYHFNTHKLNDFLTSIAHLHGIEIVDDEIVDVIFNEDGEIVDLIGEEGRYPSDFYIDCTGMRRVLISKMGAKWQSYSKWLKMKSSIVFPLPQEEKLKMYTTATAMDYGWMFNIPVWGRSGNGYIFDSDYTTADQAQQEVEKLLGCEIDVSKQINFDPGALDRVWIKNCCAVGLSASFLEPLEATSIGSSIRQVFLLMHRLPNYDENTIKTYNKAVTEILVNVRDFVLIHYLTNKTNTQFWKDISKIEMPDNLQPLLQQWKKNLPIADDFTGQTMYTMFKAGNFAQVLHGLDFFDTNAIKREYDMMNPQTKKWGDEILSFIHPAIDTRPYVEHREVIESIRNANY